MISQTKRFIVILFFVLVTAAGVFANRGAAGFTAQGEGQAKPAETPAAAQAPAAKAEKKGSFDSAQKQSEADKKSAGCISCHSYDKQAEPLSMHPFGPDNIGCADCHGGNFDVMKPEGTKKGDPTFENAKDQAHPKARYPDIWKRDGKETGANPIRLSAMMNRESLEYIQFVNPGDTRVADRTCGTSGCHEKEVANVYTSMMKHGALLWEAALYNNGGFNLKNGRFGESYTREGQPERLYPVEPIDDKDAWQKLILHGMVPYLDPLPRWEISQPGNVLRVFEHGEDRLSLRGFGTSNRTDPVFLGLQKTRLLDPTLNFLGTNDQPGDYRSSGCSACHVQYANDRQISHGAVVPRSDMRTSFANNGTSQSTDPMTGPAASSGEPGHPIRHTLTNNIPSSSCMVCHMHPGTNMVTTYYGMIWWDNETDGDQMYADKIKDADAAKTQRIGNRNPEESALRGKWGELDFLQDVGKPGGEINKNLKVTQFGDFHGHGWVYRAVFKSDRHGNYLDHSGNIVSGVNGDVLAQAMTPDKDPKTGLPMLKDGVPVHMQDIHLEMGMQCVDCHFSQDGHGNGNLYTEVRNAIEIDCIDCHGTMSDYATLLTSGPAAQTANGKRGRDLSKQKTKFMIDGKVKEVSILQKVTRDIEPGKPILKTAAIATTTIKKGDIVQASYTDPTKVWRVKQTKDTVVKTGNHPEDYSEKSAYAKTVQIDNATWGDPNAPEDKIAHQDQKMTCFACHTAWTTSCFGCHLPMRANKEQSMNHNEGEQSRNWTNYNFQTLRDDIYMLGRDGTVLGSRIAPVRSSCAVLVSSQSINREWFYSQQQTISAEGYSGQAFSTYMPHTVRGKGETKQCEDCHINKNNDNNAVMAHVTVQGTHAANWIGRYAWVAEGGDGIDAVVVTERREPQAVYGSTLHRLAFPDEYKEFVKDGRKLDESYGHHANGEALSIQARGEYLYVANGKKGLWVYDISRIDDKLFSERISTSIVSPIGQRLYLDTKYATAVASPTTLGVDPTASIFYLTKVPLSEHYRMHIEENQEGPYRINHNWARKMRYEGKADGEAMYDPQLINPLYAFLYVTDKYEGLIQTSAATLLDGDPENNFLKRAEYANGQDHWNPDGVLDGAVNIRTAGNYAYICADRGVVVVDISGFDDKLRPNPKVVKILPAVKPTSVQVQFRYGFITDAEGLKVFDLTNPNDPQMVPGAIVRIANANSVYLCRSYAFVAAGPQGLAIVNIEKPTEPKAFPWLPGLYFNANGAINDTHDVKIGMTNNSLFAYVADGKNGMHVVQLMSYDDTPGIYGFAPQLSPKLIATKKTGGPALAISEGIDRDRAVDESGNQLAVFGRRGARPFNLAEIRKLFISSTTGEPYTVSNTPPGPPVAVTERPEPQTANADDDQPGELAAQQRPALFDVVSLLLPMGLLLRMRRRGRPRQSK
ncbi:MAG TPA: hypothetical protein PLF26_07190 [Blastocatellia bacterium]|nr:hypothetical protein [Blastocatellia bacterium]